MGCLDSLERGTVEWNSGMVERVTDDPVPSIILHVHAYLTLVGPWAELSNGPRVRNTDRWS